MTLHIIGAGLAGLSCALAAADAGAEVVLHEAAGQAGGRCRSWHDQTLGDTIDNGSHLVVGANRAVFAHLMRIGSMGSLSALPSALPMVDMDNGERWSAEPQSLLPSVLASMARLGFGSDGPLQRRLGRSGHYRRFWEPLALAILNTPPEEASAHLFRRVLARTLWRGEAASRPFMARTGLSESFIDPALTALGAAGATIRLHHPLRGLAMSDGRAVELCFDDETIALSAQDQVVLAVPWTPASRLLEELPVLPSSAIVNAHFRLPDEIAASLPEAPLGLVGGTAQWIFRRGSMLSVTVSASSGLAGRGVEEIASELWRDVAKALNIKAEPIARQVIKEKRATLFHTPEVERLRPAPRLRANLVLAGDWTATGLPCTIEGALVSGRRAAREAMRQDYI